MKIHTWLQDVGSSLDRNIICSAFGKVCDLTHNQIIGNYSYRKVKFSSQ